MCVGSSQPKKQPRWGAVTNRILSLPQLPAVPLPLLAILAVLAALLVVVAVYYLVRRSL
jgi:hypothetical protein